MIFSSGGDTSSVTATAVSLQDFEPEVEQSFLVGQGYVRVRGLARLALTGLYLDSYDGHSGRQQQHAQVLNGPAVFALDLWVRTRQASHIRTMTYLTTVSRPTVRIPCLDVGR